MKHKDILAIQGVEKLSWYEKQPMDVQNLSVNESSYPLKWRVKRKPAVETKLTAMLPARSGRLS